MRIDSYNSGRLALKQIEDLLRELGYTDLARACPNISRPTIKKVLGQLGQEGKVGCVKSGRDAVWEKIGSLSH